MVRPEFVQRVSLLHHSHNRSRSSLTNSELWKITGTDGGWENYKSVSLIAYIFFGFPSHFLPHIKLHITNCLLGLLLGFLSLKSALYSCHLTSANR